MKFRIAAICLALTSACASSAESFTVPKDFVVEPLTTAGLVRHPLHVAFDYRGRMFVAVSAGVNLPFAELEKQLPHSIVLLEDSNGDGIYDRRVSTFADKLTFPGGMLWHDNALYVTSPPYLWKFEDSNGDNLADRRTPLVGKFGSTGNGADLHGPFLGPDGLLYFCDGRNGHDIATRDGVRIKGRAAGIYRCRLDGTGLERVCSGGMDNPVEVAFTTAGEPLVCTNIVEPNPRRDAILYAIDGGVYPHDVKAMDELPTNGPPLPLNGDLGWCAVSSLIRYRSDQFGDDFAGKFFTAQFNTHKVQMHECIRNGAGFDWRHADFLTATSPDFHPTAIREHPDGSLIVVDTGGWFRIGCPASQLAKPEFPGGIYRVRRQRRPRLERPFGSEVDLAALDVPKLAALLADKRWAVRDRAKFELVARLAKAPIAMQPSALATLSRVDARTLRELIWIWAQLPDDRGWNELVRPEQFQRIALRSDDVFVTLLVAASVHRKSIPLCQKGDLTSVHENWLTVARRQLAIYHSRTWRPESGYRLVADAYELRDDPMLFHAGVLAARAMGVGRRNAPLSMPFDRSSALAIEALAAAGGDAISPNLLLQVLDSEFDKVRAAGKRILNKRPELAGLVKLRLSNDARIEPARQLSDASLALLECLPADLDVQKSIAAGLANRLGFETTKVRLLEAASSVAPRQRIPELEAAIGSALEAGNARLVAAALAASSPQSRIARRKQLFAIGANPQFDADLRLAALAAAGETGAAMPTAAFAFCMGELEKSADPLRRRRAARAATAAKLDAGQLLALAKQTGSLSAFELPEVLRAFERGGDKAIGNALVDALERSPGRSALSAAALKRLFAPFGPDTVSRAKPLLARAKEEAGAVAQRLAAVLELVPTADAQRGKQLFFSNRAICAACHRAEGQGSDIGPDLSKIGGSRAARDLVESILLPSQSIARGFEPVTAVLADGGVVAGMVYRETPTAVHLALADRSIRKIPRGQIERLVPGKTSVMPDGLDAQLSQRDLADLVAYLQSLK